MIHNHIYGEPTLTQYLLSRALPPRGRGLETPANRAAHRRRQRAAAVPLGDPGAAARVMKDFAKENENFEIKALSIGGELLEANQIDVLAKLPTLDQARSLIMSVMLAPVTKLARTANEIPSKVTRVVAAVRDQRKEAA